MQIAIVENRVVVGANRSDSVLVASAIQRIIHKRQVSMRAAHSPDKLSAICIDLGAFTSAAAGDQDVAVRVDVDSIYVREIEPASGVNNEVLLIPNIEIVPRAPLEDEVAIRHELLDNLFRH